MAQLRRDARPAGRLRREPRRAARARPRAADRRGARLRAVVPARPSSTRSTRSRRRRVRPTLQERWRTFAGGDAGLEPLAARRDLLDAVRDVLAGIERAPEDFVTVVVPEMVRPGLLLGYLLRQPQLVRLKAGLLREPNVVVTDVPVVSTRASRVGADGRPLIPQRTVTLVFVSAVNDATIRAVNYARRSGRARRARSTSSSIPTQAQRDRGGVVRRADADPARHRRGAVPGPHAARCSRRSGGSPRSRGHRGERGDARVRS